ncbi:MAG: amidohydrolase [Actinobacteria bacterium]|nr:amidohydrolase [Actinomycetota bacterium]
MTAQTTARSTPRRRGPFPDLRVIDADTHITEPHDLWTSRAPGAAADRVPQVVDVRGRPSWVIDGVPMGPAMPASVVDRDGGRCVGTAFMRWTLDDTHPAAYSVEPRLEVMDELGIWAQIVYPNLAGFGGQRFGEVTDAQLRLLCVTIYNDAMAQLQEESGARLFPMGLLPWWDIEASVRETERIAQLGLRGVNMTSDPQLHGLPDLGERAWDPLWDVCSDNALPVHFHIGASQTSFSWYGESPWPSYGADQRLAIGSAMLYLTNARVLANIIYSGLLERHPKLKVVSVESGIGWIPFVLEALDHQLGETTPGTMDYLSMPPSAYFRRQMYGCYWFENRDVAHTLDVLGQDNVLFETDFPHPTCLYPSSLEHAAAGLDGVPADVQRKVLQDNAAALYRIPFPEEAR